MFNNNWDSVFMEMALCISKKSKDPRTKVGAVLVSPNKCHVSIGFNGMAFGVLETEERWADKYKYVIHAELNAIINAKTDLTGWTLYTTMFPCESCRNVIIQCGISRVIYLNDNSASIINSKEKTIELFKEKGISIEQFTNI